MPAASAIDPPAARRLERQVRELRPLSDYPDILRAADVAAILRIHEKTVLVAAAKGDRSKAPLPFALRPYRWRKRDVEAWIDDTNETDQRRALMRGR